MQEEHKERENEIKREKDIKEKIKWKKRTGEKIITIEHWKT